MPFIKLEMGYRGGLTPHSLIPITSYVAEALTAAGEKGTYLDLQTFEVKVLAPERTLVEKLFALHGAYEKGEIEKRVRHYYDVYHLLDVRFHGSDHSDFTVFDHPSFGVLTDRRDVSINSQKYR